MSRWIMWVTKEQQKCLHKLKSGLNGIKEELVRRNWKAWRHVRGWILRAHRGPHGVKHKGPISCSQHKQNGHRSSSVALTYRFSHFTDFPTLRIIIRPRALSFTGIINRSRMHESELFELTWWTCDFALFPAALANKIFIFFIDMYIRSSWSIVFQSQYGLRTQEGCWAVICSWLG